MCVCLSHMNERFSFQNKTPINCKSFKTLDKANFLQISINSFFDPFGLEEQNPAPMKITLLFKQHTRSDQSSRCSNRSGSSIPMPASVVDLIQIRVEFAANEVVEVVKPFRDFEKATHPTGACDPQCSG